MSLLSSSVGVRRIAWGLAIFVFLTAFSNSAAALCPQPYSQGLYAYAVAQQNDAGCLIGTGNSPLVNEATSELAHSIANTSYGINSVSVSGSFTAPGGTSATARSIWTDTLLITGGSGTGQVTFNAHVTGSFSQRAEAGFDMMINQGVGGVFGRDYYGFGTTTNYYSPSQNFAIDLPLSYTFTYGVPFELTEILYASGVLDSRYCCGETAFAADFSHSAFLDTIELPAGASISSLSGVAYTVLVTKTTQTLSFGVAPTLTVGDSGTVSATGGASDKPVTFNSITPLVCTVADGTVTALAAGECIIAANQLGNANYSDAVQAMQSLWVTASTTTTTTTTTAASTTTTTSTTAASTSTSTAVPTTITTVGTTTTTTQTTQTPLQIELGWNLLGNTFDQAINVAETFSSTSVITTIWKWDVVVSGWQFYAPSMDAAGLQAYASSKVYGVLASILPGEGFWVNAKTQASIPMAAGSSYSVGSTQLVQGWNLVATAANSTPAAFNLSLTDPQAPPPAIGGIPLNLITLWTWDNPLSKWYFYAPNLDGQGGTALTQYITGKGYLDFTASHKKLGPGVGFWVNKP